MLKIDNAINSKINPQLSLDYVILAFVNLSSLILCIFIHNFVSFIFLFIFINITICYVKYTKRRFYQKSFYSDIKYVNLDKQTFIVVKTDNSKIEYDKNDITRVHLDIEMAYFRTKYSSFPAPAKIIGTFEMKDSQKFAIEIRRARIRSYLNLIFRLIDHLSSQTEFEYSFSGLGFDYEFDEHIQNYKNKRIKCLFGDKDRKDLQSFSLMFLLGGLGFSLFFIIIAWDSFKADLINNALFMLKFFSVFAGISGILYIPVIIDKINLRRGK